MQTDIIRYSYEKVKTGAAPYKLFGKLFVIEDISLACRVIVNADYPMINDMDIRCFALYGKEKGDYVISGCEARIHPFRLITLTQEGLTSYICDVPQSTRGNRHEYPVVYQFIPALVYIPAERAFPDIVKGDTTAALYKLPEEKLLDVTYFLDELMIKKMHQ